MLVHVPRISEFISLLQYSTVYLFLYTLEYGMLYEFSVFARNEQGNGSVIVQLKNVSMISPRTAPENVAVTPENTTHVLVSWSELPRRERGGGLQGYRVHYYAKPRSTPVVGSSSGACFCYRST